MKLYRKICKKCGKVFVTSVRNQRLCKFCRIENREETNRKYELKRREKAVK
ncbi:hypothetical protein [Caldanaerobacter subterraneus]|uniref:Uncharacterized protein n=1 Tax=Caldanaerobacter subterraneus TaxID=911092 RepID=A0A7Y2PMQ1_9THEO|nr:hypothetical protein [Caldanaerobacter subterraneus]NNG67328.1 hypothetical protein [Caldanaerobacter subterraneus]